MTANNHLSEEEIAICADAVNNYQYKDVPFSLRKHIEECDQCMQEVMLVSELTNEQASNIAQNKPTGIIRKNWIIPASIIAVAAAVLVLFIIVPHRPLLNKESQLAAEEFSNAMEDESTKKHQPQQPQESFPETPDKKSEKISTPESMNSGRMLATFTPNEDLEYLFYNHRGEFRGQELIIRADSVLNLNSVASIEWENTTGKNLIVEIFNNSNESVKTIFTDNPGGVDIPSLEPGLYYWKLINEDFDLLFVGKIIIPLAQE